MVSLSQTLSYSRLGFLTSFPKRGCFQKTTAMTWHPENQLSTGHPKPKAHDPYQSNEPANAQHRGSKHVTLQTAHHLRVVVFFFFSPVLLCFLVFQTVLVLHVGFFLKVFVWGRFVLVCMLLSCFVLDPFWWDALPFCKMVDTWDILGARTESSLFCRKIF